MNSDVFPLEERRGSGHLSCNLFTKDSLTFPCHDMLEFPQRDAEGVCQRDKASPEGKIDLNRTLHVCWLLVFVHEHKLQQREKDGPMVRILQVPARTQ